MFVYTHIMGRYILTENAMKEAYKTAKCMVKECINMPTGTNMWENGGTD